LGTVGAHYGAELARTEPIIFYAAARDWGGKNPDTVRKIPPGLRRVRLVRQHRPRQGLGRRIAKFTKQPIDLVKASPRTVPSRP